MQWGQPNFRLLLVQKQNKKGLKFCFFPTLSTLIVLILTVFALCVESESDESLSEQLSQTLQKENISVLFQKLKRKKNTKLFFN